MAIACTGIKECFDGKYENCEYNYQILHHYLKVAITGLRAKGSYTLKKFYTPKRIQAPIFLP